MDFGIIPIFATIPALDAVLGVSPVLARHQGVERADAMLFRMMLVLVFTILALLTVSGKILVDFRDLTLPDSAGNGLSDRAILFYRRADFAVILFWLDVGCLFLAPVAVVLAAVQKRPLWMWIPLAILGTAGSAIWLLRNWRVTAVAARTQGS